MNFVDPLKVSDPANAEERSTTRSNPDPATTGNPPSAISRNRHSVKIINQKI
jgi:hypothetical protein